MFRDIETGEILSLDDLIKEFERLKAEGETETKTFQGYLRNCTDKNGTLEVIK